jgi:hypothetical protein
MLQCDTRSKTKNGHTLYANGDLSKIDTKKLKQ